MAFKRALHLAAQVAVVVVLVYNGLVIGLVEANDDEASSSKDGSCANKDTNEDGTCSANTAISTDHLDDCGIWLAPSTLPGAGLGMFAGRAFQKGEFMQQTGDVVIPIVDINMHQRGRGKFPFLWDEYTWNGRSLGTVISIMLLLQKFRGSLTLCPLLLTCFFSYFNCRPCSRSYQRVQCRVSR